MINKIIISLVLLVLASCKTVDTKISDADRRDVANTQNPYTSRSLYGESLGHLEELYQKLHYNPVKIVFQPKPVLNRSGAGEVPQDVTDMMKSSINKIGKSFVYIPYDPSYYTYESQTGGSRILNRTLPDFTIEAAITEYNKDFEQRGGNAGADGQGTVKGFDFDLGYNASEDHRMSNMTLDMNLLDYASTESIPGAQSINSMQLKSLSKNKGYSFRVASMGTGWGKDFTLATQKHTAVRSLIEIGVIELFGRVLNIPYWRAVKGLPPSPSAIVQIKNFYLSQEMPGKIELLRILLNRLGYHTDQSTDLVDSIADFCNRTSTDETLQACGDIGVSAQIYVQLLDNIPLSFDRNTAFTKSLKNNPLPTPQAPTVFEMHITPESNGQVGGQLNLSINIHQPSYLQCYYETQEGISQLYPNAFHVDNRHSAGEVLHIPAANAPYELVFEHKGVTENVACIASTTSPLVSKFDAVNNMQALTQSISGVSMKQLMESFDANNYQIATIAVE